MIITHGNLVSNLAAAYIQLVRERERERERVRERERERERESILLFKFLVSGVQFHNN